MQRVHPFIQNHRRAILEIAGKHGARRLRVFGSFARGEVGPDSDVDFLVEAGPNVTSWFPGGLVADLEDLLGRRVDVVEAEALLPALRDRILGEAVKL